MDREILWETLVPMMGKNEEYQQALQRVRETEEAYLAILETLTPDKRETLERYIGACEALDDCLLFLAYQIGLADGV